MVQTLQWVQIEKMYFEVVFNLSFHHVGEFEPCQTGFNIFTFFLSPSWRLCPKMNNSRHFFVIVIPSSGHAQPIRPDGEFLCHNLLLLRFCQQNCLSLSADWWWWNVKWWYETVFLIGCSLISWPIRGSDTLDWVKYQCGTGKFLPASNIIRPRSK